RICVVDGKGGFKKSGRYCPVLDGPDSKVECVVAIDRLDCLRRILKGTADFSIFTAEDLVTAENAGVQVLITNELRYNGDEKYEYEVVAVVADSSSINSRYDLKGKRYCHPGYGYETDWTRILSNYFESSVVPPSCDPKLTITENRVKATASFFKSCCKAGPWVNNPTLDLQLKRKYSHLCELCGTPSKCSTNDEYWGRRGSLLCLTDGAGDVSWARLDDIEPHFGLSASSAESRIDGYSFLCPDNTKMPLNATNPCVWVVKPWPVVASRRTTAEEIQAIVSSISQNDNPTSWQYNLMKLLETAYTTIVKLQPIEPIETYLDRATGFLNANSFSGCHPPRTIRICTTSVIENAKCSWLRESAAVYGIEPDLDCIKADNTTHCMLALNMGAADVVMVPSDLAYTAMTEYNLKTLFYETTDTSEKYVTVMVTLPRSKIRSFNDLHHKRVCFPIYNGVAWNTVKHTLFTKNMIKHCPLDKEMAEFFGPSCTPDFPVNGSAKLRQNCEDSFKGEFGALHCLTSGAGDVAFVSSNSIRKYVSDESEDNPGSTLRMEDFHVVCEKEPCHLSWAPLGQAMIRVNSTDLWIKDTLDVFLQLDNLFGKNYQSLTTPFTLFGKYDGKSDLLFNDATVRLRDVPTSKDTDTMVYPYDNFVITDQKCIQSASYRTTPGVLLLLVIQFLFCS
ncbi:hypothetical protein NQ317_014292, partial [Molorchus minor]